jgi:antitoxin HicB
MRKVYRNQETEASSQQKTVSVIIRLMKILNYTVIMTPDETGGYVVTCPALPGLVTEGDTLEEARAMAADAIRGYLESLQKDGEPIPTDESITEEVQVELV